MTFWTAGAIVGSALIGGAMGSKSAGTQADAARQAAELQAASADKATALQREMWQQQQVNQRPWQAAGTNALNQLSWGMGLPTNTYSSQVPASDSAQGSAPTQGSWKMMGGTPGSWSGGDAGDWQGGTPDIPTWVPGTGGTKIQQALSSTQGQGTPFQGTDAQGTPFQGTGASGSLNRAFGIADYQADPGYAFRLKEGTKALDASAAARGGLLSGNALRAATKYGQDMGSQEYQNAYNRYQTDQGNQYNRLAAMAGLGQTANTALAQSGQNYANQAGNNMMTSGANSGNAAMVAGNANASAYQGWGNAIGQGLQGLSKINWNPGNSGYPGSDANGPLITRIGGG